MSPAERQPELGLGLIEGFYGREWSWSERRAMAQFLRSHGYRFYIYAPKGDSCLRRNWRQDWSDSVFAELGSLARHCQDLGLRFGIGLSPYGLQDDWQGGDSTLRARLDELRALQPDMLCLLFDDMPACRQDLAVIQADIVQQTSCWWPEPSLLMCPSYYSRDPVLEKLFGPRPRGYWEDLGRLLPEECDVFWTGQRVCSETYPHDDLADISAALRRAPLLWDNYPVNDGARSCRFLHLDAFRCRPSSLAESIRGHAVNPMNQACLSRIPLATLPRTYSEGERYDADAAFREACLHTCGQSLGSLLIGDLSQLQQSGLDGMDSESIESLRKRYQGMDHPCAAELLAWLDGEYAFDPACLTD